MKTAVIMERDLLGCTIRQNHKTGMLNANDLHKVGNQMRKQHGFTEKQMGSYFNLDSTSELINEVCLVENIGVDEVKKSTKGKYGGTWINPIIFVDMAMWYSPQLKVRILQWVIDGLLDARDDSGDSFKKMNSVLIRQFPQEYNQLKAAEAAKTIALECKVGSGKDKWQKASEEQLKLRAKIQEAVILIADLCPNIGTAVSKAIAKVKASEH
jgi:hypothetical protein